MKLNVKKKFGLARITEIKIGNKKRFTPIFFPSVSSVDQKYYHSIIKWVIETKPVDFLLSAYDVKYDNITIDSNEMESCLMLDSGGYELKSIKDKKIWNHELLKEVILKTKPEFVLTLDTPTNLDFIKYYHELKKVLNKEVILEYVLPEPKDSDLTSLIIETLGRIQPDAIAIPEIYFGKSLDERLTKIRKVSEILQSMQGPILFHILGCSEPNHLVQYSELGVDIFDGLGWYRNVIYKDEKKEINSDISVKHRYKVDFSELDKDCQCYICTKLEIKEYENRVLFHNIYSYFELMEEIQNGIIDGGL